MKLLLVDDHSVVRAGIRRLLSVLMNAEAILEAGSTHKALSIFRVERPDVVVLDLNLPGAGGLDLLKRLLIEDPRARVLIFSMHTSALYVTRALQCGVKGYISKSAGAEEFVEAVRQVAAGGRYVERDLAVDLAFNVAGSDEPGAALSTRELDIMRLLAKGENLSAITERLGVSYKTIANSCTTIKHKLLVQRTSDLIRITVEMHAS